MSSKGQAKQRRQPKQPAPYPVKVLPLKIVGDVVCELRNRKGEVVSMPSVAHFEIEEKDWGKVRKLISELIS